MEPYGNKHDNGPQMKKYTLGVIVIVAGIPLLLSNTGFLPYELRHILFSWQMLLIAIGLALVLEALAHQPRDRGPGPGGPDL